MQRGIASAAQARFENYALHAADLEGRKAKIKAGKKTCRERSIYISAAHEEVLDEAWREVDAVSRHVGDEYADILIEHYLYCQPWTEVAAQHELSRTGIYRRAEKAFKWLDKNYGGNKDEASS